MPKFATESKWLKHTDLEEGQDHVVTIEKFSKENMAIPGQPKQERWVLYFKEFDKGIGLNATNGKMLCKLFKSEEMEDWVGKQCVLYIKDDVEFQGDIVSAIRVRGHLPTCKEAQAKVTTVQLMDQIELAESTKEILALMRQIAGGEFSEDDQDALTLVANQKLASLKKKK